MDDARFEILERVWKAIIKKKVGLVAALAEARLELRIPGINYAEVRKKLEIIEYRLELLDELVEEAADG